MLEQVWIMTQEAGMSASVLYMSMSLDGYIAAPNDKPGNPGGDGFMRLHEWYGDFTPPSGPGPSGPSGEFIDEIKTTGAVLAGRRTGPRRRSTVLADLRTSGAEVGSSSG